ncbi:hypothetical protein B0H63DRAFT_513925 [Podospora didyma]|uniref:Vacuolar protein sorting/targeting protein 10 n=1 Tax=Podospora didyma TaxID=330526 RepID=A0AAE0N6I6_9PEZI|nr:hypothetical protein B0H63DRAFT_513925 [Podospora didyma]
MRVWGALQAAALLASALWAAPLAAKDAEPDFKVSKFEHEPKDFLYFADSDVIMFQDRTDLNVYRSPDAGVTWARVDAVPEGKAWLFYMHPYDPTRAYILCDGYDHFRTQDRGKTWEKFDAHAEVPMFPYTGDVLQFHAADPDRIIFNGEICQGIFCRNVAAYTTDGFKTKGKPLRADIAGCWWAKSTDLFSCGKEDPDLDKNRILCIVSDEFSSHENDQRLVISDEFFKMDGKDIQEFEPNLDMDKAVRGIVNIAPIKGYMLVATTSANTDELALFISDDTKKWHRAMFPDPHGSHDHRLRQEAYTVLESTNYSLQIDVMSTHGQNSMGAIYTSNSNGTFFTETIEYTNRNGRGQVDFEKIAGVQGIFLVNQVKNGKDVEKNPKTEKHVVTEITFDDGRTFQPVTVKVDGKEERIHLHSFTELDNVGRVFSSLAPGLVMGNGNTGDRLKKIGEADLYVSDDAGLTWIKALDGPHKYKFGDQGSIIVAVRDSDKADIDMIQYSINHGHDWIPLKLPHDLKVLPYILATAPDASSLQFILIGITKESSEIIAIDFKGLHERTCKDDDFEEWFARVDKDNKPTCLMGHTQKYRRRKKDAKCFLNQEHKHAILEPTNCDCTDLDYECDYNFIREDDKCVANGPILVPNKACEGKPDDTFMGTSGYRKIPGNTCKDTQETLEKYKDVQRKCSDAVGAPKDKPATDKVTQHQAMFKDGDFFEKHYLERGETSRSGEETVIMRPRKKSKLGPIQITQDHGKTWKTPKVLNDHHVWEIIPHDYFKDTVFFLTDKQEVFLTTDRGETFHSFNSPTKSNKESFLQLSFHPDKADWLIWIGKTCDGDQCYSVAYYTEDRGFKWEPFARYVENCEYTGAKEYNYKGRDQNQVVCLRKERENNDPETPDVLALSNDYFKKDEVKISNDVKGYATMAEFIVVATEDSAEKTLRAHASLDGRVFAEAHFPYGFDAKVPHKHAYTVLDSSTHAINLFVATSTEEDRRFGTILKSNSNGTSYVISARNVNCNNGYLADFEKMLGLEGVAMINVVANPDDKASVPKKLQSKMTHNDGAEWALMPPPKKDEFGGFSCSSDKGDDNCALHIHGYTERTDRSKTFSSKGAVGFMVGWGNVGASLGPIKEADTFITSDAGISWKRIRKGRYRWAFGDQGSIIVLVAYGSTNNVTYSVDQGTTWHEHKFSNDELDVKDLTSMRAGNSGNFLLWADNGKELITINLDFTGFSDHVCKHDDDPAKSDYDVWSPAHPLQKNGCLFGHKTQYLRKKAGRKCYNDFKLQHLYGKETCQCTRQDFECAFNFELNNVGDCVLVPGFSPVSREDWCDAHPDEDTFYKDVPFRRIPLTTCISNGPDLDTSTTSEPCPHHEEEYQRKHAPSAMGIFFAIIIPVAIAAAAGWYVWRNWSGKFGQIRLGEHGASAFDSDQPWVKYPVIVISAIVAAVVALPIVAASMWRLLKSGAEKVGLVGSGRGSWTRLGGGGGARRFTTRDSFARGSGDYDIVDEDEGELLGEDSEEEV